MRKENSDLKSFFNSDVHERDVYEFWFKHQDALQVYFPHGRGATDLAFMRLERAERTPSVRPCVVKTAGGGRYCHGYTVKDFGDGSTMNPFWRLLQNGYSRSDATKLICEWLGNSGNEIYAHTTKNPFNKDMQDTEKPAYQAEVIRRFLDNREAFKPRFMEVLRGFMRACDEEEIARLLSNNTLLIGFNPQGKFSDVDRVMLLEQDENRVSWGHWAYNRNAEKLIKGAPKGKLRKHSKRVLLGSHLIKLYGKDIIYAEGHTDFINNIAKGYACVTTGSSTKGFSKEGLELLSGKTLHDFPDSDEPGIKGAMERHIEIVEFNKGRPADQQITHIIYKWGDSWNRANGEVYSPAMIEEFQRKTLDQLCRRHWEKTFKIPDDSPYLLKNWVGYTNKSRAWGYDFVDFHLEHKNAKDYTKFLAKFKFDI